MKHMTDIIEGPEYTCAMEPALHLSIMKHNAGGPTYIRLVDENYPNSVKVFAVEDCDVEKIAGDLIQL